MSECPEDCGKKYKLFDGNRQFKGWFCNNKKQLLTEDERGVCTQIPGCSKPTDQIEKDSVHNFKDQDIGEEE